MITRSRVVPENFQQLMEYHPTMVRNIVVRFCRYSKRYERQGRANNFKSSFEADVEEYIQSAYLHLMTVPEGTYKEQGFTDRIEIYDKCLRPEGMTPFRHFAAYLGQVVTRHIMTLLARRNVDAMGSTHKHERWTPRTVMVDFERRLDRERLLLECGLYIANSHTADPKLLTKNWKVLAKHLGIEPTESGRVRIKNYITKYFPVMKTSHKSTLPTERRYAQS